MVKIIWIAGGLMALSILIYAIFSPAGEGNYNGDDSFIFEMPG